MKIPNCASSCLASITKGKKKDKASRELTRLSLSIKYEHWKECLAVDSINGVTQDQEPFLVHHEDFVMECKRNGELDQMGNYKKLNLSYMLDNRVFSGDQNKKHE